MLAKSVMSDYDDCILFLLAKAYQQVIASFKGRLKEYGLTPVQNLVLSALREEDGVSIGEIGRKLLLDPATLAGTLDRMSAAGWLDKIPDAQDGRVVRVWQTEKARQNSPELSREIREINEKALRGLSLEEKLLLKRLLRDLKA
jgi:DNA-binding MarR family transcriptional regulator